MEKFFQVCISFDNEIEIKELILRRYHNVEYIFSMEVYDFLLFLQKAREKEKEEQIRAQWTALLPNMDKNNYISFSDYYDRCTGRNIDTRSAAEIIQEIKNLHGIEVI